MRLHERAHAGHLGRFAEQPSRQVVGEACVGTAVSGRGGGAHDPDRSPGLRDPSASPTSRHPAMNALVGVGDPQRSAVVADRAGEPPFVERQQPAPGAHVRRILIFRKISLTSCSSSLF